MEQKHIVIDARIRRASSGRPIERLVELLQDSDTKNRYTIIIQKDDPWKPHNKNFSALKVGYKNFSFNPLQQVAFSYRLYRQKADLVVFTLIGAQPMFYFKKFVMYSFDTTMLHYTRAGKLPSWLHKIRMIGYRFLFWQGNKFAKHIIAISQYVADELAEMYKFAKDKTTVIYLSGDLPNAAKSIQPKGVEKPFIMHVGSPFPHKNIERLIEAFGLIKNKHPHYKLVLAGKKEQYFEKLEAWAKNLVYFDDIVFTGFVSDGELRWLYENADCYVLPALSEGFGLPGLEAMAYSCPVASSNATCLPEIYGDAVIYFDPKSIVDISEKVSSLLSNQSTQKRLIKKGHEQLSKYSWQKMTNETLGLFNSLL